MIVVGYIFAWPLIILLRADIASYCRIALLNLEILMDIPKKLTVDDKDYLLEDLNDETKKFVQDCMASNNVTDSKRLQIEIASIAQAKKLDELGGLLVDVQCFEK